MNKMCDQCIWKFMRCIDQYRFSNKYEINFKLNDCTISKNYLDSCYSKFTEYFIKLK